MLFTILILGVFVDLADCHYLDLLNHAFKYIGLYAEAFFKVAYVWLV